MSLPIFKRGKRKDLRNHGLVSLTLIPGKMMEQITLENICKHINDKKVTETSQQGFMKGKSCLTNLNAFYDKMILTAVTSSQINQ